MNLNDLFFGEILELTRPVGCAVDTADADEPKRDSWIAGDPATFASVERSDPLAAGAGDRWHTNNDLLVR